MLFLFIVGALIAAGAAVLAALILARGYPGAGYSVLVAATICGVALALAGPFER